MYLLVCDGYPGSYCPFGVCLSPGPGEPDAHCWAEATHAAERFPRHLKWLLLASTSSPLPPHSHVCFLPRRSLSHADSCLVSFCCCICFFPLSSFVSTPPPPLSHNVAGWQKGTLSFPFLHIFNLITFWLQSITFPAVTLGIVFKFDHKVGLLRSFWKRI